MSQLCPLRNRAIFHRNRVVRCLILFGMVLVSGCTSEAVAVSSTEEKPITLSSIVSSDQRVVCYMLTPIPVSGVPSRPLGKFPFMLVGSGSESARIIDQNRKTIRSAPAGGEFLVSKLVQIGSGFLSISVKGNMQLLPLNHLRISPGHRSGLMGSRMRLDSVGSFLMMIT